MGNRGEGGRALRALLAVALTSVCALAAAPSAGAAHHLVRITSVFPGTTAQPAAEYVELQLTSPFENQFFNQTAVRVYNSTGTLQNTATTPTVTLANGQDQRYVLAATSTGETQFATSADMSFSTNGDTISPAGGAACFESSYAPFTPPSPSAIDCVSWGNFTGEAMLPSNAAEGTSRAAMGIDQGIFRNIGPNCSTLHQASDDTNDSATDFPGNVSTAYVPHNNAFSVSDTRCRLTVTVNGLGTVTGGGINCGTGTPNTCSLIYDSGEAIVLTATTSGGSTFTGWESCSAEAANQCSEDMHLSQSVTANFAGGSTSTPSPAVADNSAQCAALRANLAKLKKKIKKADDPEQKAKLKKKRKRVRKQLAALGC